MAAFPVNPRDERPHPPGPEPFWGESWYLDFATEDASLGGYLRVGLYPNLGLAWYWACVVGPDRPLVTVIDHAVPLPRGESMELRGSGLWADYLVEEPVSRVSVGLEAYGVALDDPADTYRGLRGDRTALAFDLEWEIDGEDFNWPSGLDRYEIPCRVAGEIAVGEERIDFDGIGQRDHSWGVRDWWVIDWCWSAFRLDDGTRVHAVVLPEVSFAMGYVQEPGGPTEMVTRVVAEEQLGDEGIPTSALLEANELRFEVEPVSWSPVLLEAPDGRIARFPRAMSRFRGADGRDGIGWIEFNQPPT